MSKLISKAIRALGIGWVAGFLALGLWQLGWLDAWEAPVWKWRVHFFSQRESPSDKVKLILLDQDSLTWMQDNFAEPWPWARAWYASIIKFCQRGGARAVAMDLLFTEPSVFGVEDDEDMWRDPVEPNLPLQDPPTVLGLMSGGQRVTWPDTLKRPDLDLDALACEQKEHLLFPVPEVAQGASALGHVVGQADDDGIYRHVVAMCRFDAVSVPALGLATWLQAEANEVTVSAVDGQLTVGSHSIPLDKQGRTLLRFKGKQGLPQAYPAALVLQSEGQLQEQLQEDEKPALAPDIFKDCLVFVGCKAPALLDLRPIPINNECPGVVLHATFADNLITDSFMAQAPVLMVVMGVMLTALIMGACLTYWARWWQAGPLAVLGIAAPIGLGFVAYSRGYWWPVVAQATGAALAMVGALVGNYWAEGRQKAFIKRAFKHYLSAEVIEKILHDPQALELGGEKRELTIMFTDLAGFSSFSERLGPVELTALLNDYLTEMTNIIMEEGGTLDKFEGDAIIAFWNAPLSQPDHAVRACRAVLRCQRRLAELRPRYRERTGADLRMRVGLNTGEVVVGNMGSSQRFNYTILGDAANLAARLEGANKAFGTETMVSESTWRLVSDEFQGRKLADLRVVGRKSAVTVFEMTGFANDQAPEHWEYFARGLENFRAGEFSRASKAFAEVSNDPACLHYMQRCQTLDAQPPENWDGVWELIAK
jgi:adenylate cyclase